MLNVTLILDIYVSAILSKRERQSGKITNHIHI